MLKKIDRWFYRWPFFYYWLPPLAWMLLIFIVSAQPTLPHAPQAFLDLLLKKGAHMLEYAILFVLLWRALSVSRPSLSSLIMALALTMLYAASDEFHQTFVPGRQGRLTDVLIDSSGAAMAALATWMCGSRSRQKDAPAAQ